VSATEGAAPDRCESDCLAAPSAVEESPPKPRQPALSVVLPVLDEAAIVTKALGALASMRARGVEIVVVGGGSRDGTVACATGLADLVIVAPRGRGRQMNAGAAAASGTALLFLHIDTQLPPDADRQIVQALRLGRSWGRFDLRIAGSHRLLAVVAAMTNLRSRLTGIATGDQAMFMTRDAYLAAGGFPDIPLMEDIAVSKRLKQRGSPVCLAGPVITSGRRWEKHGVVRTVLLMWRLRLAYFLGVDPARLARAYGYVPPEP
jgi:rSAM/selenodomain-associated transferase 2